MKQISFDEVFLLWLKEELKPHKNRNVLDFVKKEKGFSSLTEWRLNTALRLGLDKKSWNLKKISNPFKELPKTLIGPFPGWQKLLPTKLQYTFEEAVKLPSFLEWCKNHNRIQPILKNFPKESTIILLEKEDGRLIHIEGGHRICAIAYANAVNKPINLKHKPVIYAAIAKITNLEFKNLQKFLKVGTNK